MIFKACLNLLMLIYPISNIFYRLLALHNGISLVLEGVSDNGTGCQHIDGLFIWQLYHEDTWRLQLCAQWSGRGCHCVALHISLDGKLLLLCLLLLFFLLLWPTKRNQNPLCSDCSFASKWKKRTLLARASPLIGLAGATAGVFRMEHTDARRHRGISSDKPERAGNRRGRQQLQQW